MQNPISGIGCASLILAIATSYALAQRTAEGKHVKEILSDQPREAISGSKLCQRAWASPAFSDGIARRVAPASLEPDLSHLMADSDEVILASSSSTFAPAISPSGNEAHTYYDVKVMRTWKGSHQVGDIITFAVPNATLSCLGTDTSPHGGIASFSTITLGWRGAGGPYILFLRKTTSDQVQFIPGYRLTGAGGAQGLFGVPHSPTATEWNKCDLSSSLTGSKRCYSFLEESQAKVKAGFGEDSLFTKYDGMPISEFLEEVQDVADSLGYDPPGDATN